MTNQSADQIDKFRNFIAKNEEYKYPYLIFRQTHQYQYIINIFEKIYDRYMTDLHILKKLFYLKNVINYCYKKYLLKLVNHIKDALFFLCNYSVTKYIRLLCLLCIYYVRINPRFLFSFS
jgi:hypothetical protein